jgi:predicted PurR-regulated permease PerM
VTGIWILATLAVLFFLRSAAHVLVPIVIAVLLSYVLEPVVRALRSAGCPLLPATIATMLAFAVPVGGLAYLLADQGRVALGELPQAVDRMRSMLAGTVIGRALGSVGSDGDASAMRALITSGLGSAMELAGDVVVVCFLVFFLLLEEDHFCRRLVEIAGPNGRLTRTVLQDINGQIRRFVVVRAVTAILVGVATWLVLAWMGVAQALLWGVMAGAFNSVPYFGPVIVSGGLFVIGIGQTGDINTAVRISGAALVITSIEGWLVTPPLLGKVEAINATVIFLGLLLWTWIWGPWGTLLAVPMLVFLKAIADHLTGLKPLARLMAR